MEEEKLMGYQEKWFVLHHKSLYNENPNLIGFREEDEWRKIKIGHLVVYYQAGARRIRGIYEVTKTGTMLDRAFGKEFRSGELKHQHEMNLIQNLQTDFSQYDAGQLSFHRYLKNPIRWDNRRVFPINNNDLKYIMSL